MENQITITLSQRERENVNRLAHALSDQIDTYPAQLSHYLHYVSDQLVTDIQSLVDVASRLSAAMREQELYDDFNNRYDRVINRLAGGRDVAVLWSPETHTPDCVVVGKGKDCKVYSIDDLNDLVREEGANNA